ncbi:MAG: DUF6452 family protein [Prevotella sp.]|uniref:DUF6452 family protein n=1 Tax=Prevotella sp. AGR2160 TaxID=1280674 RepID=UPI00041137AF|nr:DUF6452 family protein [Prevotella sp. AGR2160]MDD5861517.1 DUF6452 family protein [Prevotella sp.]
MRRIIPFLFGAAILGGLASCESIDCPMNNTVYSKYKFAGNVTTLEDTLTITTHRHNGSDTTLCNQLVGVDSLLIPMSYSGSRDSLFFTLHTRDFQTFRDTVTVAKDNEPHFESIDCTPSFFHQIQGVSYTKHAIDSITIHTSYVNYDQTSTHFYLYMRPSE